MVRTKLPKRRKIHSGLMLAIRAAGKQGGDWRRGKFFLAEALGIKQQSINLWTRVPRNRIFMVHKVTGVPLAKLAPDLFKDDE